jgi:hypothetical protein
MFLDSSAISGTPTLIEVNENNDLVKTHVLVTPDPAVFWFDFDPLAKTVIYPSVNVIMEIAWDYLEWGTFIWSAGYGGLSPEKAAYDLNDKEIIWMYDSPLFMKLDRHRRGSETFTTIDIQRYGQTWNMSGPMDTISAIHSTANRILLSGTSGQSIVQTSVAASHPTLTREGAEDFGEETTDKNQFPEYRNLILSPTISGYKGT